MELIVAALPFAALVLYVSYRLERAEHLDETERQRSRDALRDGEAQMLRLLSDIQTATPAVRRVMWSQYRLIEYDLAQRQVQHLLRWGEGEDRWNYRQNLDGALKRQHEAAMAAEPYRQGVRVDGPREGLI